MTKNKYSFAIDGFSLVEIAMVLLIIGIIASSVFKGKDILETAQIRSVASDIESLRIAYGNYVSTYSSLPGDDSSASSRFSGAENGDGNGQYSQEDANKFFPHLYGAGLIQSPTFKKPKIGGTYSMIVDSGQIKLKIADSNKGAMTAKQISILKAKLIDSLGPDSDIVEIDGTINQQDSKTKYVVKILIN